MTLVIATGDRLIAGQISMQSSSQLGNARKVRARASNFAREVLAVIICSAEVYLFKTKLAMVLITEMSSSYQETLFTSGTLLTEAACL